MCSCPAEVFFPEIPAITSQEQKMVETYMRSIDGFHLYSRIVRIKATASTQNMLDTKAFGQEAVNQNAESCICSNKYKEPSYFAKANIA